MKIKNTKNFIDFCNEIGLKAFFSEIPVKKFNYDINNFTSRKGIQTNITCDNQDKHELLKNLKERVKELDCNLKKTSTNLVFGDGDINADLMLIGEAPGSEEDKTGFPFVGQAGDLLNLILQAIKKEKNKCYISNVIFWRPPGNRNPSQDEIKMCLPFIKEQIEIISPKFLILLGNIASQTLLKNSLGITKICGQKFEYELCAKKIPCWPIFHPAFLLRNPYAKKELWLKLCQIYNFIEESYENKL